MSYRGTLPSGQAFPGQDDQIFGQQSTYGFQQQQQQQGQQQSHHQPPPSLNQHQQFQHPHHQALYSGGPASHAQQFYSEPQAQQGIYIQPQQYQQRHPARPSQHTSTGSLGYNSNVGMPHGYDAVNGNGSASHHSLQQPTNLYLPQTNTWQQSITPAAPQAVYQPVHQIQHRMHLPQQQSPYRQSEPSPQTQIHVQAQPWPSPQLQKHQQPSPQISHWTTPSPQLQQQQLQQSSPRPQRPSPLPSQQKLQHPPLPSPQQQQPPQQHQQQQGCKENSPHPQAVHTQQEISQSSPLLAQAVTNRYPAPSHEQDPQPQPRQQHSEELEQQHLGYVNLQDIQRPPLPPAPPTNMGNILSAAPADLERTADPRVVEKHDTASVIVKQEEDCITVRAPADHRIKPSPHSSVTNSPALSTRSPSITKRSPAVQPKPRPANTIPIMVAIAEECLDKARASSHDVAMSLCPNQVDEYQKLIATGLSCLEAAMQSNRLPPREDARVRLRYAAILQEETENLMEAETAIGKGITLCEKHRLYDLKYCMQYLLLKVGFQHNQKAGLKAVDDHIKSCQHFKHVPWYYAFRLLKASFYLEIGNASDPGVVDNLRAIQSVANERGDKALYVFASLLEGFTLLKTRKDGNIERVHTCIAQAAKFQFDPTVKIVQLELLSRLLEVVSSLPRQNLDHTTQQLRQLQKCLDECEGWHNVKADFLVPIKKQSSSTKIVSDDTSAIITMGAGDCESDFLVMSFMTKMELRSLVFMISGLTKLHKPTSQGGRPSEFWREGLKILDTWDSSTSGIPYGPAIPLNAAIKQRAWRTEAQAYLNVLLGLVAASHCQWDTVKQVLEKLEMLVSPSTQATVRLLSIYLTGVYHQGTGNLEAALGIFLDSCFTIPKGSVGGVKVGHQELSLLAGLNRLWIMQHPSCRNDQETLDLIEQLQPHCMNHWNIDLRTAWHNVMAALVTEPTQQLNQQKQHIHAAMAGSKATSNILGAAVTLCIMRSRFFENVIGEQALKSARAAAKQAQRSGNVLWQSVADGMLAHSYEVQGQREEAKQEWDKATMEARGAFARSL